MPKIEDHLLQILKVIKKALKVSIITSNQQTKIIHRNQIFLESTNDIIDSSNPFNLYLFYIDLCNLIQYFSFYIDVSIHTLYQFLYWNKVSFNVFISMLKSTIISINATTFFQYRYSNFILLKSTSQTLLEYIFLHL